MKIKLSEDAIRNLINACRHSGTLCVFIGKYEGRGYNYIDGTALEGIHRGLVREMIRILGKELEEKDIELDIDTNILINKLWA